MQGLMVNQLLLGRERINQDYQGGSVFQKISNILAMRTFFGEMVTSTYKEKEFYLSLISRFDMCIL